MIDDAVLAFGPAHGDEFFDDFRNGVGIGTDGASARTAAEGAHAAHDEFGFFARKTRDERLFQGEKGIAAFEH